MMFQDNTSSEVVVESQAQARAQQAQKGGIQEATLEEVVTMIEQGKDSNGPPLANEDLAAIQTRMGHWQRLRDSLSALKRKRRDNDNEDVRKQIKLSGLIALPTPAPIWSP